MATDRVIYLHPAPVAQAVRRLCKMEPRPVLWYNPANWKAMGAK